MARIPGQYRESILKIAPDDNNDPATDSNCLAQLKDYRSLMPLAQEARKPMFSLKPADGAFGGHQAAVLECFSDFKQLTRTIAGRAGIYIEGN